MKKTNWIIVLFAVVLAIALVILYLSLGFLNDDHGLDIVLAIIWMVLVAIFAGVIQWRESIRRRLIRRFFVCDTVLYNSELGSAKRVEVVPAGDIDQYVIFAKKALADLKYGFDIASRPDDFEPLYVIDSDKFKVKRSDTGSNEVETWTGSVSSIKMDDKGKAKTEKLGEFNDEDSLKELLQVTQVFA